VRTAEIAETILKEAQVSDDQTKPEVPAADEAEGDENDVEAHRDKGIEDVGIEDVGIEDVGKDRGFDDVG
jgi:hypothetical protein